MKASSNHHVPPETTPHVGARFIAPWATDNPPSSPIAASFAARKPRAAARLADPFANPATQKAWAEEHALAFTVAGMARDDILAALRDGLTEVIAGKLSREEWLAGARQRLIKAGYWREEGEKGGITPSRLQLIFDTNTANAYHGGRWQRLEERRETHPYLMYLTKRDHRVRPEHRAWEGLILPIDHPFWQTHFPPNGFRCRCAVLGVTQAEYDQLRRDGGQFAGGTVKFDNDIDADLEALDPGFAYNPGIPGSRAAALARLAEEKNGVSRDKLTAAINALPTKNPSASAQDAPDEINPNIGLEHLPETDRTSIEEAALDANAPGLIKMQEAIFLFEKLSAELGKLPKTSAAYRAKAVEHQKARETMHRLLNEYGDNCQRCVIAYELRRRGFDVTARKYTGPGDELALNWKSLFSGMDAVPVGVSGDKAAAIAQLEQQLLRFGEGSRSIVAFGKENRPGHVLIAEVQGGKIVYVDPTVAEVGATDWKEDFLPASLECARIDLKPVNPRFLHRAVKAQQANKRN